MESRGAAAQRSMASLGGLADISQDDAMAIAQAYGDLWRKAALGAIHRSGMLLLERVYGGAEDAFHRRGPKGTALPQIAAALQSMGFNVSAAKLRRVVRQALVLDQLRLRKNLQELRHLSASHVEEACALPLEGRVEFLLEAERQQLTVMDLRAVRTPGPQQPQGRGDRTAKSPRRLASAPEAKAVSDSEDPDGSNSPWSETVSAPGEAAIERIVTALESRSALTREQRIDALAFSLRIKQLVERLETALQRQQLA